MTTAQLFVDAVDTALTLARWAIGWVITFATVGSILTVAAIACGVRGRDAASGRLDGRQTAETGPQAAEEPRPAKRRPVPAWAHTEPYDYDHAA